MRPRGVVLLLLLLAPCAGAEGAGFAGDAFIRPGALLPHVGCTVGFVFGPAGAREFATAGHCVKAGERVAVEAAPGVARDVGVVRVARDAGPGEDYALVTVDEAYQDRVHRGVLGAVPRGAAAGCAPGTPLLHVGRPAQAPAPLARAGVCVPAAAPAFAFAGAAWRGDSGSPVVDASGAAVGIVTHLVLDAEGRQVGAYGTRVDVIPAALASG